MEDIKLCFIYSINYSCRGTTFIVRKKVCFLVRNKTSQISVD